MIPNCFEAYRRSHPTPPSPQKPDFSTEQPEGLLVEEGLDKNLEEKIVHSFC